jgi:hypothetical protein
MSAGVGYREWFGGWSSLSYTIYLEIVLSTKMCDQKHGGFYVTIDLFSWGFPLTRGSNIRGRQSSTPPDFTVIYVLTVYIS